MTMAGRAFDGLGFRSRALSLHLLVESVEGKEHMLSVIFVTG